MKPLQPSEDKAGKRCGLPMRELSINPDHWYAVAQSREVGLGPVGVTIWNQPVCLFRNSQGFVRAIEDRCPHRLVRISHGRVTGETVECPYHGWRFGMDGRCVYVPGMIGKNLPEGCHVKAYPVLEQDGFIWIFPGRAERSSEVRPMPMVEWDDLDYVGSSAKMSCRAHFSFVVENLMDMYHGHLHQRYQTWTVDALEEVVRRDGCVAARYAATSYYRVDRFWSALQLVFPALRKPYSTELTVTYQYPHWKAKLGDDFVLYGVFCPVNPRRTEGYLIHYTSLRRIRAFEKAPLVVKRQVKRCLGNIAKGLLEKLISQDLPMVEEEQRAYEEHPDRKPLELNRTLHAVERLIRKEAEKAGGQ